MENTNKKRIEIVIEIDESRGVTTQIGIGGANAIDIIAGYVHVANSLAEVIANHDGAPKEHVLDTMAKALRTIASNPDMVQKADEEGADHGND